MSDLGDEVAGEVLADEAPVRVPPRYLAARGRDLARDLAASAAVLAIRFGIPGAIAYAITGRMRVAAIVLLALCVPYALLSISAIEVSRDGLRLRRTFGRDRRLGWGEITAVSAARPGEVFLHGWLLPLLTREMTGTSTIAGHVRIEHRGGYFYYPPRVGVQEFLRLVEHRRRGGGELLP